MVCADIYVALLGAAQELIRNGLRFIGVVKTATRRFPKAHLSIFELTQRRDFSGWLPWMRTAMFAFVWMDRDRRY